MPTELLSAIEAIKERAWYPLASIILAMLIALWKRLQPGVWDSIPVRWQWLPAALMAAAAAFVDAAAHALSVTAALTIALYALLSVAAPAIGLHHTRKRLRRQ